MAAWEEKAKTGQTEWIVLRPEVEGETTGGQKYLPLGDGFVPGPGLRADQAYGEDESEDRRQEHNRFRMELLNDRICRAAGPGRSIQGTAALSEFAVEADVAGKVEKLKFVKATRTYNPPETLLDPMYKRQDRQEARHRSRVVRHRRQRRHGLGHRRRPGAAESAAPDRPLRSKSRWPTPRAPR